MLGSNKILKIIFVLLLLIVIAEVTYYFSLPKNISEEESTTVDEPVADPYIDPATITVTDNNQLPPAFNIVTLNYLARQPSYPNSKITTSIEHRGRVLEISNETTSIRGGDYTYGLKLEFQASVQDWVYFLPSTLKKAKIYIDESGGGIKKPANISDIKVGNTVILRRIIDPFYEPTDSRHLVELEINIIT